MARENGTPKSWKLSAVQRGRQRARAELHRDTRGGAVGRIGPVNKVLPPNRTSTRQCLSWKSCLSLNLDLCFLVHPIRIDAVPKTIVTAGGNRPEKPSGQLLAWLAPAAEGVVETVPIPKPEPGETLALGNGMTARSVVLRQSREARRVIEKRRRPAS